MRTVIVHRDDDVNLSQYTDREPDFSPELEAPLGDFDTRYNMGQQFAEGGFSTVHVAQDRNLRRFVAVKSLRPEINARDLFISEAKITAQLDHPAIVPVYGLAGDGGDGLHLCMKLINGKSLRGHLRDAANSGTDSDAAIKRRLELFLKVCDAITYAHARNIIHGDLKPDNIICGEYGEVYVVDWGLAKHVEADGNCLDKPKIDGTPRYFAPETVSKRIYGKVSEVFTLGLILQEVVTLKPAVPGRGETTCMYKITFSEIEEVRHIFGVEIDRALQAVIEKAVCHEPEKRYQSVEALADDLRRYLAGEPTTALPDNVFARFARWAVRRRKECVAGALAVLFAFAALTAAAIFRQLQTTREAHAQSRCFDYMNNRTATVAAHLDTTALQIQEQLSALARICAYLLAHNPGSDAWQTAFRPPLAEIGKTERGMFYSPYYKRLTAMSYGLYTLAPDADKEKCVAFMRQVSPALRKMRNIVLGSVGGYNFAPAEYERLQMAYLYDGAPVRSVFIGTANGLKILYPWRGTHPRDTDPRKREWYKSAMTRRGPAWGKPYMDFASVSGLSIPSSMPIIGLDGKLRGVVGLDLSLNKLTERILSRGNVGNYVIGKAVVNRRGEEVFSSKSQYFNAKFDPEKFHEDAEFKLPLFATPEIRDRILKSGQGYGAFIAERLGRKVLYSFAYLEVYDMFFVTVADCEKLKKHIGASGR